MIFNSNEIYAKVWDVKVAENGKYIDLRVTTSEKDQEDNYKNSTWFPRCIGHAVNSLRDLKVGDSIKITKSKFTNESYVAEDGTHKSRFRFLIFEASLIQSEKEENVEEAQVEAPTVQNSVVSDNPW